MRVYVLQHAEPETPGLLADILGERGVAMETIRTYAGERVPATVEGRGGLVVIRPLAHEQGPISPSD
jgi:hypothetical protein